MGKGTYRELRIEQLKQLQEVKIPHQCECSPGARP
jgi:hypothetical protein